MIISLFSEQFAVTGFLSIISGKKSAKAFVSMRTVKSQVVGIKGTSQLILLVQKSPFDSLGQ